MHPLTKVHLGGAHVNLHPKQFEETRTRIEFPTQLGEEMQRHT